MRGLALASSEILAKQPSELARSLIKGRKRISARNNAGRITVRYRGGGHKRLNRTVDFKRYDTLKGENDRISSRVISIEYDPNRSASLALLESSSSLNSSEIFYKYIICPINISVGSSINCSMTSDGLDMQEGNSFPLSQIRVGTKVHNIELKHGSGGVIARSAGAYAELMSHDSGYAMLKLSSGEIRMIPAACFATVGIVSNLEHKNENLAKAGRRRWAGIKPHVRGVAMNPVDHPHGGGEGKTSGGRHPVTPWGKPTKGKKTRHVKRRSEKLIKSRG